MRLVLVLWLCFVSGVSHGLVILQYHHVSDRTPKSTSISPALFKAHLNVIEQANFQVVDIRELQRWLKKGASLPDRSVVITFDDGYRPVYDTAFPELKRRKWPFTVFVNSKAHDEKNPSFMTWDELRELTKHGGVIANHTDSHPHLIRQQSYESFNQWLSRREREITFAEERIRKEIGRSDKLFAYPFGEYDQRLQTFLKERGYLAFGQQSGPVADNSHHQALPRFPFGGIYGDVDDFKTKLTSLPFPQARVKVTDNGGALLENPELPKTVGKPVLRIASPLVAYLDNMNCFASGQGRITTEVKGGVIVAQALRDLPPGRSRYNCTAHAGGGRFYWHSQLFIRKRPDGSWVNE